MDKKLSDLTVTELKAALFDTDQQIKQLQQQYSIVGKQLQKKLEEEQQQVEQEEEENDKG
jgi:hypothetical protein